MTSEHRDGRTINGVPADRRRSLAAQLADARRVREFSGPWTARVTWEEGFRTRAHVRGHTIPFDEPADLAADDTAPTPHEHVLSALGACLAAGLVMHATVAGIALDALEVEVSGTFDNILRWAGLAESGSPGFRGLEVRATLGGDAPEEDLRDLWDRALAGSPVAQTLAHPTPVSSVLRVRGRG
ncbi:OsmC family protein [Patulibacter sp. S7RM1-6]